MADDRIDVRFGAQLGELQAGLREASASVQQTTKQMNDSMGGLSATATKHTSQLSADFTKMSQSLGQSLQAWGQHLEVAGKNMTAFGTVPLAAAGTAILALTKKTAEYGEELTRVSGKTQTSVEALGSLHYAANLSAVGTASLDNGLKFLAKNMGAAADGVKVAKEAFAKLGIDVETLKGKKPDEVMLLVADGLKAIEDPAQRVRVAMQLFGRAGADLLPLLLQGAGGITALMEEGKTLGAVMSEEDVKAAKDTEESIKRLDKVVSGLTHQLGTSFLPVLKDLADALLWIVQKGIKPLIEWFKGLDTGTKETATIIAVAFGVSGPIVLAVGAMMALLGPLLAPLLLGGFIIGGIIAGVAAVVLNWQNLKTAARDIWTDLKIFIGGVVLDIYNGVKQWLVDKFGWIVEGVRAKIEGVKAIFRDLKDALVGHSTVPEMVDAIGAEMSRLSSVMVGPAQSASDTVKNTFAGMQTAVHAGVLGMIRGTQTFQGAIRSIWQSVLADFISNFIRRMIAEWLTMENLKTLATVAGEAVRATVGAEGALTSLALQAVTAIKAIWNDAATTFAGVFAYFAPAMGPYAAIPAAAASAVVGAAAGSIVSAAGGWDVPADSLAMVHKNEMVLPAALADSVRNMTGDGGAGRDLHLHITAVDAKSFAQQLARSDSALSKQIKRSIRDFRLRL
jgi:hypothetical protein